MSAVSDFLSRDALAAAVVALVLASPAAAASKAHDGARAPQRTHVAARPVQAKAPLTLHVTAAKKDDEVRLAGIRKAYDGMVATRDQLYEGTRVCMKDQRWLLMKVRDSFSDDGLPMSDRYVEGIRDRFRRAIDTRRTELAASRVAEAAPAPTLDPSLPLSREAQRAGPSDLDWLRSSADRLHSLRTSCLGWAQRTIDQVSSAAAAPMTSSLDRIREARAAAERDYRTMQDVTPDSAADVLASMDSGPETATLRMGSL